MDPDALSAVAAELGIHEVPNFYNGVVVADEYLRLTNLAAVDLHIRQRLAEDPSFVQRHVGTLWRLAFQCPFVDVSATFQNLYKQCEVRAVAGAPGVGADAGLPDVAGAAAGRSWARCRSWR